MEGDGGADGDSLGGAEEAGDDADGGEHGVELPELRADHEEKHEAAADSVAADHGGLERPAVNKDAGDDAEDGDREQIGDLEVDDLLSGGVEAEGEDADDGEESEEVAEDGDDLGVPEPAHDGDAEDGAHRERIRSGCGLSGGGRHGVLLMVAGGVRVRKILGDGLRIACGAMAAFRVVKDRREDQAASLRSVCSKRSAGTLPLRSEWQQSGEVARARCRGCESGRGDGR